MTKSLRHRGPDDEGIYCSEGIGIGSTRLSILDLSSAGHMPMLDEETGNRIVHNGEIYNFKEIRDLLAPVHLKSKTDTEIILKAYARFGTDCLRLFNGIFGFSIWDERRKELFCARDRLGIKPFVYASHEGAFYFASEVKALLAAGVPCRPNMKVIQQYLTQGVYEHDEETFFMDVFQLPPGSCMTVGPGKSSQTRYWDLTPEMEYSPDNSDGRRKSFDEVCEEFSELMTDAMRLQLHADASVGIHVSGGLDSSLMMAIANKLNGGQGKLRAFTQIYGEEKYDETPHVSALANQLGWEVEYHKLDVSEVPDLAKVAMLQQEQPYPGMVTLAKQKLVKSNRHADIKVVLEGNGGDEIGGGYQYYLAPHILDLIENGYPELGRRELRSFARLNDLNDDQSITKMFDSLAAYFKPGRSADGTKSVRKDCLTDDFLSTADDPPTFRKPFRSNLLNMQYRDIFHTKLPRILRSCDRAAMGYGREMRAPLLDHRLVEYTFSMPPSYKIEDGVQRRFMRNILNEMKVEVAANVPKRAVVNPQREWFLGALRTWVQDIISSQSFKERGIFDARKVREAFDAYTRSKNNQNSFPIWQWISIEMWYQTFIDTRPGESPTDGPALHLGTQG